VIEQHACTVVRLTHRPQHYSHPTNATRKGIRALLGNSGDEDEALSPGAPRVKRDRDAEAAAGGSDAGRARVKREPGLGGGGSVYLDLTKPADVPLKVGGREVGADEIAVCDLVDSDGEEREGGAARWEVRKREVVDVEEGA